MVGVSDPEFRLKRSAGWRFIGGLATGYVASTLLLSIALAGVALVLHETVAESLLRAVLLAIIAALGLADLLGRTPHANRQVPQRFVRDLEPLPRGLLWGLDLGLLITTQKTSSLVWVAIAGLVLSGPVSAIPLALLAAAAFYIGGVTILSFSGWGQMTALDFGRVAIPVLQRGTGVVLIALAIAGLTL